MDKEDNTCINCKCEPNAICWPQQNKLREQWLKDNPDSQYIGWMSI